MHMQHIPGGGHPLVMFAHFEYIELLLLLIPVATNAFKAGSTVLKRVRRNADFGLAHRNDTPLKVGIAFIGRRDPVSGLGRPLLRLAVLKFQSESQEYSFIDPVSIQETGWFANRVKSQQAFPGCSPRCRADPHP